MENKIKKEMLMVFLVIGLAITISLVSAFGASTPYWDENPLKLAPGESTIIELTLQNMVGAEDIVLTAKIDNDGDGIATLVDVDTIYSVPFGTEDVKVPIRVEVPETIERGGIRTVIVSFMQVSSTEGGMVGLSSGFTTKFIVNIVGVEDSVLFEPVLIREGVPMWGWLLAIIIIVITVFWIYKKKSK